MTSIPSGPMLLPVPVAPALPPVETLVVEEGSRGDLDALLALLAQYEDPAPEPAPVHALLADLPPALPDPVAPLLEAQQRSPAAAPPQVPAPSPPAAIGDLHEQPVMVVPLQSPPPFVPPGPPVLAPALLEAAQALVEPRVALGFRDGSTAELQPGSDQARALEDLARLLTSR